MQACNHPRDIRGGPRRRRVCVATRIPFLPRGEAGAVKTPVVESAATWVWHVETLICIHYVPATSPASPSSPVTASRSAPCHPY